MVPLLLVLAIVAFVYLQFGRRRQNKLQRENAADAVELAEKNDEMIDVSEKLACPQCKRMVPTSFSRCPGCGRVLKDAD